MTGGEESRPGTFNRIQETMYLNLIEIAESFGVAEKVVEDWIREQGLPHTRDRGRLLFDRGQVAHWAASHGLTSRAGFLAAGCGSSAAGVALEPMLRAGGIWRDVAGEEVGATLERIVDTRPHLSVPVRTLLVQRLRARGGLNWAPVGEGFALPHFGTRVTLGREAGMVALIATRTPCPLPEPVLDTVPVTRLLFFIPPSPRAHLELLGKLGKALGRGPLREAVERAAPDEELFAACALFDRSMGPGGARGGAS